MKKQILFLMIFLMSKVFAQSNGYFSDYYWLTDCERERMEFTPPDSTYLISEDCGISTKYQKHQGPKVILGNLHTNDFIYWGNQIPSSVNMLGCATASANYSVSSPIPSGSLQYSDSMIAGVQFGANCNLQTNSVVSLAPTFFASNIDSAVLALGGIYVQNSNPSQVKKILFTPLNIQVFEANKALLKLFGPQWSLNYVHPYPNGPFIYVVGSDVYVSGTVNSAVTLVAERNIIIDDDLKYECTDSTGLNFTNGNCDDELGLIANGNVLIDARHVAVNKGYSWNAGDPNYANGNHEEGIIINAAIAALGESFGVHSANFPISPRFPNDPFAGFGNYPDLGNHGKITHLGSLAQKRRGVINSLLRGGYKGETQPDGSFGPEMECYQDYRFIGNPPIGFEFLNALLLSGNKIPNEIKNFELNQNFPNPFNPSTRIDFTLKERTELKLEVFSLLGKKIETLAKGNFNLGNYSFEFNGKNLASGIYFYRLTTKNFTETKKMLLIR